MKFILKIGASFILYTAIALPASAVDTKHELQLEEALAGLRDSDAEWRRENAKYREQRQSNALSPVEAEEYAEFVASLHTQKLEYCENVRRIGGNDALDGFDCIKLDESPKAVIVLPPSSNTAKTESEIIEALEIRLQRVEADIDEQLLQRQQSYQQNAGEQIVDPDVLSDPGAPSSTDIASENSGESGQQPPAAGGSRLGNFDPGAGPGREKEGKSPPIAVGASEDGNDDDIVMRQIREAAEQETDPVLKKKLWAEYQKLKAAKRN